MLNPNERLRRARLASEKSEQEVAAIAGLRPETYFDLESGPYEVCMVISLDELLKICRAIGVNPVDIVGDTVPHEIEVTCRIDFQEFRQMIQEHLDRRNLTLAQFEEIAGWELSDFMSDSKTAWNWNADCLRFVAGACGINWLAVLPMNNEL